MSASTPTAAAEAPPFGRDRLFQAWAVVSGLSLAGDSAWFVAFAWTAATVADPATAGLVLGAGTIPRALTSLYGGTLADRHDARRVVMLANAGRIVVLSLGAVLATTLGISVGLLLGIAILFGVLDALHNPAASTLPRVLLRSDDLPNGAGLMQVAGRLARFGGAPLGGVLVAVGGLELVMAVDAVTFCVVAVFVGRWLRPRYPRELSSTGSFRRDLAAVATYLREAPPVRAFVVSLSGLNLFVSPALAVGVTIHVHRSGWGSATVGVADALVGVGAAVGALFAIRFRSTQPARTGLVMLLGQALAIGVIGVAGRPVLLGACAVIGITAGLASTQLSGAFQQLVDPAYLGRLGAVMSLGDDVLMPVALVGFGALVAGAGLALACLAACVGFIVMVSWALVRLSGAPSVAAQHDRATD
ncbi:MFS transporter [Nocardioides halotolerans]|uniref:MFS transporter n=1 Tax=Nocardioides halotolerans TaxID=433660 RepID=UPI000415C28E|nr:MFS transporter [Nocardioides halotolerans]